LAGVLIHNNEETMMAGMISMQALGDELEIRNLIAHMAHLADDGTLDDYVGCMTEDAVWEMRPASGSAAPPARRGHADIRAGSQERRNSGMQGPGTHSRHMVTTTVVSVAGDSAAATSCVLFVLIVEGKQQIGFSGIYHDEFRRTPQGWRLSRRAVVPV
jgi:3-phenylpropionate/cinnamic acid dioxygenase small subunit